MAWTAPTIRAPGYVVTAADWNTDIVDNLDYLKSQIDLITDEHIAGLAMIMDRD
ncbi:MAG: hypothetical protein Q8P44_00560 [Dehalococcoidia bacterium]|nr:hypothetical protein [Dehalococcoidia bacterium]